MADSLGDLHDLDKQGAVKAIEMVKTKLGEFDTSGRRRPVPTDEVVRVDCDTVILAVGEKVDPDFAKTSGLKLKDAGTVEVDRYSMETSRERFYAGGDLVTGASNVSRAMRYGRQAARKIDRKRDGVGQRDRRDRPQQPRDRAGRRAGGEALRQRPAPRGGCERRSDWLSTPSRNSAVARRCLSGRRASKR